MMFKRLHVVLGLVVLLLIAIGVARRYGPVELGIGGSDEVKGEAAVEPHSAKASRDEEQEFEDFDLDNFDRATSTAIDSEWWPLTPGTRWIYEGFSIEEGERTRHMVVDTVTDLKKEINGVRAAVSLEEDYSDGELVERELAFHAQDKAGNVWHLGQLREEYEGEAFLGAQAWLVGHLPAAKAGIRMLAEPRVGESYSQGYAPPPFYWTDSSRVAAMGEKTSVAAGDYENVMVIEEWDAETPQGIFQTKYYAPGVGMVRVGFKGPDPEQEEMELVKVEQLSPSALTEARDAALKIEERAYVYGRTEPAEQTGLLALP